MENIKQKNSLLLSRSDSSALILLPYRFSNELEVYNMKAKTRRHLIEVNITFPRYGCGLIHVEGSLYLIGGWQKTGLAKVFYILRSKGKILFGPELLEP